MKSISITAEWDEPIQHAFQKIEKAFGCIPHVPHVIVQGVEPTKILTLGEYPKEGDNRKLAHKDVSFWDQTCHVKYLPDTTALVLPKYNPPDKDLEWNTHIIVHEFGHVLHRAFKLNQMDLPNITWYANENKYEQFAECFTFYVLGEKAYWKHREWQRLEGEDERVIQVFDQLKGIARNF